MSCSNADVVRRKAKQHPCVGNNPVKFLFYFLFSVACTAGPHGHWEIILSGCLDVELVWKQRSIQDRSRH